MKLNCLKLLMFSFFVSLPVYAQTHEIRDRDNEARKQLESRPNMSPESYRRASAGQRNVNSETQFDVNGQSSNIFIRRTAPKPKIDQQDIETTSINPEDKNKFEEFLKEKNTGIIRLQNADVCASDKFVIHADTICPNNIEGKATGYSFRTKKYSFSKLADIFFESDKLTAGGIFSIGLSLDLGDVNINELQLRSDRVKQLFEFFPPTDETEIKKNWEMSVQGMQIEKFIYKREVELKVNNTYVSRIIAYKGDSYELFENKRKDVLVVFKPVRKHDDGSITLVWKELSRINPPKVVLKAKQSDSIQTPDKYSTNEF